MFSQKIDSLQSQILKLQQQQTKYRNLEQEASVVLASIARLHQAAAELEEQNEIEQMIAQAIGFSISDIPQEVVPEPEPEPEKVEETYEEIVERITSEFRHDCIVAEAFESEPPTEEDLKKRIQEATGVYPMETIATLVNLVDGNEVTVDDLEKYLDPECLQQALNGDDPELALMEIASLLDTSHQDDVEERARFFVENLPAEMSDRLLTYLPKSIALQWVQMREKVEQEARDSLFPPITRGTRVEVKSDGEEGTVSWVGQSNDGEPVASVTVAGGTRGSIPAKELEIKPEASQNEPSPTEDPEVDELARLCLKQKAWSQMRLFADCNPNVIIRMQEIASTKTEKRIINNLPSLILGYIGRANDRTDLEWLPEPVLSEVEALLTQPQVTAIA